MTTNNPGTVTQQPLYGCTSCYEECTYTADHLRVYENECWCDPCWDERRYEFPDQPRWRDLEPYTPALQEDQPEVTVPEIIKAVANYVGSQKGGPYTPAVIKAAIIGQLEHGDVFTKLLTSPAPICNQRAEAVPGGWNIVTNENWNIPRVGQRVILFSNGVVQEESYTLDQADGEPGFGYYFWSRDDLDECPEVKAGDMWISWPNATSPTCSQQSAEAFPPELENPKYLYGQRVIVDNNTVATFRHYENEGLVTESLWVELPDGVVQWKSPHNVKPLPGGHL